MSSELPGSKVVALFFVLFFTSFGGLAATAPSDSLTHRPAAGESIKSLLIRYEMVRHAQRYLGLSYRYGGRSPQTGFDCSGFTSYVLAAFSVPVSTCSRAQAADGRSVKLRDVRPGDLIFFRRSSSRPVSHVAMVVENNEEGLFIIHSTSRGVVIDNLNESRYWKPKVHIARDVVSGFLDRASFPPAPPVTPELAPEVRQALSFLTTFG